MAHDTSFDVKKSDIALLVFEKNEKNFRKPITFCSNVQIRLAFVPFAIKFYIVGFLS
jgi:hypothetical protein